MAKKIEIPVEVNFSSLQEARSQLKQFRNDLTEAIGAGNQEAATAIAQKIGKIKDALQDANEQVKIFTSGSKFESLSNNLSDVRSKIASLDFGGAAESAQNLANLGKTINFGDAAKSVKDLGSTFLNLGKTLLTNPLFLLAAVIAGVVYAVVQLLDKIGVLDSLMRTLTDAMEVFSPIIEGVVQFFKDLADSMGLTNNAAKDWAKTQADAAEKSAKSIQNYTDVSIQSLETDIKIRKLNGQETRDLEMQKLDLLRETAAARLEADKKAYESARVASEKGKKLTEEEIQGYTDKINKSRAALQQATDNITIFEFEQTKISRDAAQERAKNDEIARKEALQKQREYNAARLSAARSLKDLEIQNMEDGIEKDLAANTERYTRLIQDTLSNEKLLAKEKAAIKAELEEQQAQKAKEIADKYAKEAEKKEEERAAKALDQRKKSLDAEFQLDTTSLDRKLSILNEQMMLELANKELTESEKLLIQQKYAKEGEALLDEQSAKQEEREKAQLEAEKKRILERANAFRSLSDTLAAVNSNIKNNFLSVTTSVLEGIAAFTELSTQTFQNNTEKVAAYVGAATSTISGLLTAVQENNKQALDDRLADIDSANQAEQAALQQKLQSGLITQAQYDKAVQDSNNKAKAAKLAAEKKAFEDDKKLKVAQAVISGIQGAVAAFAGAMQLGPIAGPIVGGVLAAAVAAMTALNVSKIQSTKFEGGGGSVPSAPSVATPSVPETAPAQPNISLFGNPNTGNNASAPQAMEQTSNQTITVNAVVSETEITATQAKIYSINKNSEL